MFGMDAIVRRGYAEFLHGRIAVLQVNAADVCKCRSKAIVHLHLRFDDWNGNNLHSKNERSECIAILAHSLPGIRSGRNGHAGTCISASVHASGLQQIQTKQAPAERQVDRQVGRPSLHDR